MDRENALENNPRLHEILNKPDLEALFRFWDVPVSQNGLWLNKEAFPPNLTEMYWVINAYYVLIQNNVLISVQMVQDFVAVKTYFKEELYQYLALASISPQEDVMPVGILENFKVFCESVE